MKEADELELCYQLFKSQKGENPALLIWQCSECGETFFITKDRRSTVCQHLAEQPMCLKWSSPPTPEGSNALLDQKIPWS